MLFSIIYKFDNKIVKCLKVLFFYVWFQGNTQASQAMELYNLVKERKLKHTVMESTFPEVWIAVV